MVVVCNTIGLYYPNDSESNRPREDHRVRTKPKSKVRNYMSPDGRINEKEQPELNLLSILAQVKAQVDKQMQDEKVELYKDLLLGGNNENVQLM